MKHAFLILLPVAIVVTGIFLPYFHGNYDYFAVGRSHIFQFASFASLLFVPVGLVWYTMDIVNGKNAPAVYPVYLSKIAIVVATVVVLAGAPGAFVSPARFRAIIILGQVDQKGFRTLPGK